MMKLLKHQLLFTLSLFFLIYNPSFSQENEYSYFYPSSNLTFLDNNNQPYANAFAGGMYKPQFSTIDLNFNGIEDIFVFDRSDGRIMTFYNNGSINNPQYTFTSEYEDLFPELRNFVLLKDYNNNGLKDIYTYSPAGSSGIRVYRNDSENGELKFSLLTNQILKYKHKVDSLCEDDANLYLNTSDLPAIGDISGNGELDILTFGTFGGIIDYYRNVGEDCFGSAETLAFTRLDWCWGRFSEGGADNTIDLGVYASWCDNYGKYGKTDEFNKKHAGATPTLIDINANGAMDLIIGDADFHNLQLLINGKHSFGNEPYRRDTMIQAIQYFPESHPVEIYTMPAAYLVDVNNNGKLDMVVAPNDQAPTQTLNQVWLYKNVSDNEAFEFEFVQDNFIQESMIDIGRNSTPAFIDINGNGLYDLIVGTGEDTSYNQFKGDRLVLFENIGTADSAIYKMTDNDFMNLSEKGWIALHPAFGDLNGNGSLDLLLGTFGGSLIYFENTAAANEPVNFQLVTENFANINVGMYSTPFIFDYNGNGLADLIIGCYRGTIYYYENTGSVSNPDYELITDTLGQVNASQVYTNYIKDGQGNIIDTVYNYSFEGFSAPVITDMNNNGSYELIVGSLQTGVTFYKINPEDPKAKFERIFDLYFSRSLDTGIERIVGRNTKPALAILDTDSFPDMLIGNRRGGLFFYTTIDEGAPKASIDEEAIKKNSEELNRFNIFPNPATSHITIRPKGLVYDVEHIMSIYNLMGQKIATYNFSGAEEQTISLTMLNPSIYIIIISEPGGNIVQKSKLQLN